MATIRVEKNRNFTVMSNTHLRDKNLSLKAKGLLSVALSLPDNWEYSLNGLVAICKESETAVKSAIKELKEAGYLTINRSRNQGGIFEYEYVFHEKPMVCYPMVENPPLDNPPLENPQVENVTQLNTNILNTKELNTNILNTEDNTYLANKKNVEIKHKYGEYKNVLLTDTDLEKLKAEFPNDWQQRIEKLSIYKASTGKSYKNDLATIRNWARRDKEQRQPQPVKKAVGEFVKGDLPF